MNILGIVAHTLGYGDAGAALMTGGRVAGVVEEERFSRIRYDDGFPWRSIAWLLDQGRLEAGDIDEIAIHVDPWRNLPNRLFWLLRHPIDTALNIGEQLDYARRCGDLGRTFASVFNGAMPPIRHYEHHLCHAAAAFYTSQFERAAYLTLDGTGEGVTGTIGVVDAAAGPRTLVKSSFPHSLGFVYSAIGDFIGFTPPEGPGKVMGLAGYGDAARFRGLMRQAVGVRDDRLWVNLDDFLFHRNLATPLSRKPWVSPAFARKAGFARRSKDQELTQIHIDLAAALQERTNEIGVELARRAVELTGESNLCIAGGVALNSVMNGKIHDAGVCEALHIQPAAGDAGNALGAVFLSSLARGRVPDRFADLPYSGPGFGQDEIESVLRSRGIPFVISDTVARDAAEAVSQGKVVGWFQGRMEYGPRALGCRSILADPRNPQIRDVINSKVKHREWFRPFAPSIAEEALSRYFGGPTSNPYMLIVAEVREQWRAVFPAVTHVDGSARVQSVSASSNARYHELLRHMETLTGHPIVLNTSFNDREPIVCTPEDAARCFLGTNIDMLFMGDCVVDKEMLDPS
jgi:carbamoyltransferase